MNPVETDPNDDSAHPVRRLARQLDELRASMSAFERQLDNLWRQSSEWEKNRSGLRQSVEDAAKLASDAFLFSDGIGRHLAYGMQRPGLYETSLRENLSALDAKLRSLEESLRTKSAVSVRNDYMVYVRQLTDWVDQTKTELESVALPVDRPLEMNATGKEWSRTTKRGRKPLSAEATAERDRILVDWQGAKEARIGRKQFCRDKGIEVTDLERYQDWQRLRQQRSYAKRK